MVDIKYCGICGEAIEVREVRKGSYTEYQLSCGHVLWASSFGHEYHNGDVIHRKRPKYCCYCGQKLMRVTVNNNTGEIVYYGKLPSKQCSYPPYCPHCNKLF